MAKAYAALNQEKIERMENAITQDVSRAKMRNATETELAQDPEFLTSLGFYGRDDEEDCW